MSYKEGFEAESICSAKAFSGEIFCAGKEFALGDKDVALIGFFRDLLRLVWGLGH